MKDTSDHCIITYCREPLVHTATLLNHGEPYSKKASCHEHSSMLLAFIGGWMETGEGFTVKVAEHPNDVARVAALIAEAGS